MKINDIKNNLSRVETTIGNASGKLHLVTQLLNRVESKDVAEVMMSSSDFEVLRNMITDAKDSINCLEF